MMEPTQDREGEDLAAFRIWNLLLDVLMRPGSVEVVHIRTQHLVKLLLMEDEQSELSTIVNSCTGRREGGIIHYQEGQYHVNGAAKPAHTDLRAVG